MSTILHPRGPEPPRTYWRRRVATALVLLGVLLVVWLVVRSQLAPSGRAGLPTSPSASATTTQGVPDCVAGDVSVTLTPSAGKYPGSSEPQLTAVVTNVGTRRCTVQTGPAGYELLVVSGPDRIYSSTDCPVAGESALMAMDPGSKVKIEATWPRIRSARNCPDDLPDVLPGTYRATLAVAGTTSDEAVFQLTS